MKLDEVRKLAAVSHPITEEEQRSFYEQMRNMGFDTGKLYQELEMSGRFVNTHQDTSYSKTTVSLHSHVYYEIIYCRAAQDVEYLVGSNRYRLQQGDIILIPPGVSHRPILPDVMTTPYQRDVIWINSEFVARVQEMFHDSRWKHAVDTEMLRTVGTRWEYLGDLFRRGVAEEEMKAPGWEMAVVANTLTILNCLKRASMDAETSGLKAEKPELFDRITDYIENHYGEYITLGELSRIFYVSESTISHLFKQKMGISFYRYVTQRRLIAAKNLIEQGGRMNEISVETGFLDYSSFYRAFRQEFGISPRQYRNLCEANSKASM